MRVAFYTLGCKVNQYETEAIKESFVAAGHRAVPEGETADCYIINTCTVTNMADRKSRQFIRRAKKQNPDAIIAVTGCYAQVDPESVSEIEGVNIIAGTNEKSSLVSMIEEYDSAQIKRVHARKELCDYKSDGIITAMDSRTRAYVKIQEGCDRFCSYCIIPFARGPIRSRSEDEILEEVTGLIERGFKEIVLTGINTALYGKDGNETSLSTLLGKIDGLQGEFRIRLSSLEPTVVRAEDVEEIVSSKRLCHHLHLSIQSGSDRVLKAMNRNYDRRTYLDILKMLREKDPLFGISTDIIVGFPGEEEKDFADSLDLVDEGSFAKVHVFKFSPRKGTKAADMEGKVSPKVKDERSEILTSKAEGSSLEFRRANLGEVREVLFEEKAGAYMRGYTDNYVRAYAPFEESRLNTIAKVRMKEIYEDGVICDIISE